MVKILIADDDSEDRELLKLEIERALEPLDRDIRFAEAKSVKKAKQLLTTQMFDMMTLDIEFDRMNEGIEALPEIFETWPTLNIIIISGKLNKSEVSAQLFRFTKDNVLKGKRWSRHFDVLDKKDDKTEAFRRAYSFAVSQREGGEKVRELFLLAESYLEKGMLDRCVEIYQKIQGLIPGDTESVENIAIFRGGLSLDAAHEYFEKGETVVASLLLGYYIESRLKEYTAAFIGCSYPSLADSLKMLEENRGFSQYRKGIFSRLARLRNKAIHEPTALTEQDFDSAKKELGLLTETLQA
jgi:CheY-like chemotaxis protein